VTESVVRPGQVWADSDKREAGRTVRVERVECQYAYCRVLTPRDANPLGRIGHEVRILIDRMRPTSTGYRLVSEATS
jgi:hypothetical protein